MGAAMAKRVKATILFATETGKSQDYAKTLCEIFKHAFDAKVCSCPRLASPFPKTQLRVVCALPPGFFSSMNNQRGDKRGKADVWVLARGAGRKTLCDYARCLLKRREDYDVH